jgi:hypothetical protein
MGTVTSAMSSKRSVGGIGGVSDIGGMPSSTVTGRSNNMASLAN